jgi:hypothetical protein
MMRGKGEERERERHCINMGSCRLAGPALLHVRTVLLHRTMWDKRAIVNEITYTNLKISNNYLLNKHGNNVQPPNK